MDFDRKIEIMTKTLKFFPAITAGIMFLSSVVMKVEAKPSVKGTPFDFFTHDGDRRTNQSNGRAIKIRQRL